MSKMSPGKGEGALRRVARDPVSRRRFFALGGGTSAAAFLAACGGSDDTTSVEHRRRPTLRTRASQFGEGDLGIVNYALTLEYLETAFYNDAAKSGLFKGDDLALIKHIADTEQQHVDALTATAKKLGGPVAKAPKAEFPLKDPTSVLKLAATVENLGAAAYLGQAANIQSPDILAAALGDPLGRGPPRRGAQRADRPGADPGRGLRPGRRHAGSPRPGPAVPRLGDGTRKGSDMQPTQAGAPELAKIEVEGLNRSALLMRGVLAAGALYGTARSRRSSAAPSRRARAGDIDILNYALTLEYLEAAFYEGAAKTPGLSKEVAGYVKTFGDEEQEHVDALMTTIKDMGGTPVKAPKVDFGDAFTSADKLVPLAITFEDTGVSAYNGAAPMIQSKDLLATAGGIVQVEARHAATIRLAAGESPAPDAFDPTLTMDEVLKAVQPYVKS